MISNNAALESYPVRVVHMASMARSGETMLLRSLAVHSMIRIAGQLFETSDGQKRLVFFRTWESPVINSNHEMVRSLNVPPNGLIIVKQGTWEHPWKFDGFILSRNPLSIYYSLINYDSLWVREIENILHKAGLNDSAIQLKGNFERFYRWSSYIDKNLIEKFRHMDFLEIFCAFYNRRMEHLRRLSLPIIYYENLVANPEANFLKLCRYLDITYESEMIRPEEYFVNTLGHGKNQLDRKISSRSNDKAKSLSMSSRSRILALTQNTWKDFGYQERDGILVPPENT